MSNSSLVSLDIQVLDVNDNSPQFIREPYTTEINEVGSQVFQLIINILLLVLRASMAHKVPLSLLYQQKILMLVRMERWSIFSLVQVSSTSA